jgi:penicillin amidase
MTILRKTLLALPLLALTALGLITVYVWFMLRASLPVLDGELEIKGLAAPVQVEFDTLAIPRIEARTREDAFRALGFVTARDRLFQMELIRRKSAGTLAEVLGAALVESDRWHRVMGFEQVARAVLEKLPPEQLEALRAYAEGVNEAMAQMKVWPFEFLLLGYSPSKWRMEDSVLVVLGMYEKLSWSGDVERSVTVMDRALPKAVTEFLTPDTDPYTDRLTGNQRARRPPRLPPMEDIQSLSRPDNQDLLSPPEPPKGSNAWAVAPQKTRDGRALLANDMHLPLGVPNLWYRAELHYGQTQLHGLTLPGIPVMVSGTNRKVAWGFANTEADVVDLVPLDIPVQDPTSYQTPEGPRRFEERRETIRVRNGADITFTVRSTLWGPALPKSLLGHKVVVHWIALDPGATNLDLMNLDKVSTVREAMEVFNRAGMPPQNVLIADTEGNIGWTLTGRIPARFGLDGLVSRSWADGTRGWRGYVEPDALPRILNPPSGFLVSANQRMVGRGYPHIIGHNYANGYRAYRITERLRDMHGIQEEDMLDLQLDNRAGFYEDYRRLALEALKDPAAPDAVELRKYLKAWDGEANPDSRGLPLLEEFRRVLAETVISPWLARCRAMDPKFVYSWKNSDAPLLKWLSTKRLDLLPNSSRYPSWEMFIRAMLEEAAGRLRETYPTRDLKDLSWEDVTLVRIRHPLSEALPLLGSLLDMADDPLPGCIQCVRAFSGRGGATERLVVAPGHEETALLHIPGGQSGHPLSPHYSDQHPAWAEGRPTPLLTGPARHRLFLRPRK